MDKTRKLREKVILMMICLCVFLQGDIVFSGVLIKKETWNYSAISYMKKNVKNLYRTGQITESEKEEALKLLAQEIEVLVNSEEVERIAGRIPIDLNQGLALETIKELSNACSAYYAEHKKYPSEFSQLSMVLKLNKQRKDGYVFSYKGTEDGFTIKALPIIPKVTGINNYYVDQTNNIRFTTDGTVVTNFSSSFAFTPFYEHHDPVAYFKNIAKEKKYRVLIGRVRGKAKSKEEKRHKITIIGHKKFNFKILQDYKAFVEDDMKRYGLTVLDESVKSSFEIEDYNIEYKYNKTGMKGQIKILATIDVSEDIVIKINILEKKEE